jgi:hypothetical protein
VLGFAALSDAMPCCALPGCATLCYGMSIIAPFDRNRDRLSWVHHLEAAASIGAGPHVGHRRNAGWSGRVGFMSVITVDRADGC